jgi:hypothetical protein
MLRQWEVGMHDAAVAPQFNTQDDLKTLAFHILNRAGFGVRLEWPGIHDSNNDERGGEADRDMVLDGNDLEGDQGMRFGEAMLVVVDHLKELFIFPKWVLSEHFLRARYNALLT